jgi:hypothetical protein
VERGEGRSGNFTPIAAFANIREGRDRRKSRMMA